MVRSNLPFGTIQRVLREDNLTGGREEFIDALGRVALFDRPNSEKAQEELVNLLNSPRDGDVEVAINCLKDIYRAGVATLGTVLAICYYNQQVGCADTTTKSLVL